MPDIYIIAKKGGKFHVHHKVDGKPFGDPLSEHDSYKEAGTAIQTLGDKWYEPLTQSETNYMPLSNTLTEGRACANCRFFKRAYDYEYVGHECHLIENWPEEILETGVCDRWEEKRERVYEPTPMPVYIVDPDDTDKAIDLAQPDILRRALKTVVGLFTRAPTQEAEQGFKVDGNRWIGWYSNNFKDRQAEIISNAAWDDFTERAMSGKCALPELWHYHVQGSKHGAADWVGRLGNFMIASGTFDNTPDGDAFKAHYRKGGSHTMSHGFFYLKAMKQDGVYHWVQTFEVSTLPPGAEANSLTFFDGGQYEMKASPEQIASLAAIVGPERAKEMAASAEKLGGSAEAAGIESKASANPVAIDVEDKQAREGIGKLEKLAEQTFEAVTKMADTVTQGEEARNKSIEDMTTAQKEQGDRIGKIEEFLNMSPRGSQAQASIVDAQKSARDAALMAAVEQGGGQATGEKDFFTMFGEMMQQRNGQAQPQTAGE